MFQDIMEKEQSKNNIELDLDTAFKHKFLHEYSGFSFTGLNNKLISINNNNVDKFTRISKKLESQMVIHEVSTQCKLISQNTFI